MNTNSKMSSTRSSPASPRSPKVQQQSWDAPGCSAAPKSPHRTIPTLPPQPFKSPKSPRHFKNQSSLNCYEQPRSPSISTYSSYSYDSAASRKYENPPRSPKITTTYANDDTESNMSYYQTPSPISRSPKALPSLPTDSPECNYYLCGQMSQSPHKSPHLPRKFVFDTPPSSSEQTAKKFEYYEPQTPDDDDDNTDDVVGIEDASFGHGQFPHSLPLSLSSSPYNHRRHNSLKGFGRPRPKDNIHALQEIDNAKEMFTYQTDHLLIDDPNRPGNNIFLKRDSCVTESTQISMDSTDTNNTSMTAATTLSSEKSGTSGTDLRRIATHTGNGGDSQFNELAGHYEHSGDQHMRLGRRHAINITSNPGYQVLHSSHSTLDRTCSDSVVSLRCRKSTSDLTYDMDDMTSSNSKNTGNTNNHGNSNGVAISNPKPRRRGSSKGGLAYLASRRNSRESMKSACSNTSIFSNDDIGPLAFQASSRGRQRRTSNFLELPVPDHVRPRVCSLPDRAYNPRLSDDLYRLRHFSISKGNVVNCGDSIISRRSRSNTSVNSTNSRASERSPFDGSCCGGGYANVDSIPPSPDTDDSEPPPPPRYRIVMLGDAGVGKTALVSQFMTSEYMHTYDASLVLDDEFGEKTVSVLLDDEESELVFIDHPSVEMSVENSLTTYEPHGCVVVFSVVDKTSFRIAEEIINYLWKENITKDKAVILVGNKADLARARVISTQEGKSLAASRDSKFIETSSGIQHNVDELLVGTLKQIRLKENRERKATSSKMKTSRTHISLHLAKEILQKICLSDITKSKSCENLHVL